MKKLVSLLIVLILFSCGDSSGGDQMEQETPTDNFVIKGKIINGENQSLYLESINQKSIVRVTEVRTDSEGNFEMSGNIPGFNLYQLRLGEGSDHIIPLTLVPEDEIEIKASAELFEKEAEVSGSKWAKTLTSYLKLFSVFHENQQLLMAKRDSISNEVLKEEFMKLRVPVDSFSLSEMKKDPSNPFNIVLHSSATPSMGYKDWDPEQLALLKSVASAYETKYPDSPATISLSNQVYMIEIEYMEHVANTSGTRPAPEIIMNDPEGIERKLSDLRGQYVLIDFWASWCAPCRAESPNVVRMYKKYKSKGFTVFSVSLDGDSNAWKEAIQKDGLEWPNHVSDLKKWESPIPQLYGFNGIPHTVLINPEGNIIGVGLRGEELEQKLNELFAKK